MVGVARIMPNIARIAAICPGSTNEGEGKMEITMQVLISFDKREGYAWYGFQ